MSGVAAADFFAFEPRLAGADGSIEESAGALSCSFGFVAEDAGSGALGANLMAMRHRNTMPVQDAIALPDHTG